MGPTFQTGSRDQVTKASFDFLFKLINKMFEKGFTTPQKIADDIDYFCSIICSVGLLDLHTSTRFMVQTILYCKTIKNLGTKRHEKILMDSVSFKTLG